MCFFAPPALNAQKVVGVCVCDRVRDVRTFGQALHLTYLNLCCYFNSFTQQMCEEMTATGGVVGVVGMAGGQLKVYGYVGALR